MESHHNKNYFAIESINPTVQQVSFYKGASFGYLSVIILPRLCFLLHISGPKRKLTLPPLPNEKKRFFKNENERFQLIKDVVSSSR